MKRSLLGLTSSLVLIAACGGGSSASPERFFEDLEAAVVAFSADLDEIDADYLGRSWDVPTELEARSDFVWETEIEVLDEYIDVWHEYVDQLDGLQPPEGFPEAGEGYAEGLPEYFEAAIVDTERAALAAVEARRGALGRVEDPELIWSRELPDDQAESLEEASEAIRESDVVLEDEWELFEDSADAAGHPIDDAVDLRLDLKTMALRASFLVGDITQASQ